MAQNIGEVTVKIVPELDQAAYERLFKLSPDATWEFPPSTVHLSPESIDALATAIAAKLGERQQPDPTSRPRRYWAHGRKA